MTPAASDRAGLFISVDGPGGVGKSTLIAEIATTLDHEGVPVRVTAEPTRTPLGDLLRHSTDTYHGIALGCLVAGDRHHHIETEIMPALAAGELVVSDRYLPSSLVLQRIDRLDWDTIWRLNAGIPAPDLAVIVNADPELIGARLYHNTADRLTGLGWPVVVLDATGQAPQELAARCANVSTPPLHWRQPECRSRFSRSTSPTRRPSVPGGSSVGWPAGTSTSWC